MIPEDVTRIGYFLAPQGLQGGIKLFVLGQTEQLKSLKRVYVEHRGWLKIRRKDKLNPGMALYFAGVTTREIAAEFRGLNVYASDSELPALDVGEYYYHDLRGLPVSNDLGELLGEVSDVLDAGHQDLLQVTDGEEQALIPLQAPYVKIELAQEKPVRVCLTDEMPEDLLTFAQKPEKNDLGYNDLDHKED